MINITNNTANLLEMEEKKQGFLTSNTSEYDYMNADGSPHSRVTRKDISQADGTSKKEIRQSHFDEQQQKWVPKGGKEPFPPYNLLELLARPDAPILIVEGEKTAEAAKKIFPDFVVTTSAQGSNSAYKTDWSPLKGRNIILCPDFDAAGIKYVEDVIELSRIEDSGRIRYLPVQDLVRHFLKEAGIEKGDDLADVLQKGLTAEAFAEKSIEAFLVPVEETISSIIQERVPIFFNTRIIPILQKKEEFQKIKSEALKQNEENQQKKEDLEQQIADLEVELAANQEELKVKKDALPNLESMAYALQELYLGREENKETKAAFEKANKKRITCKNIIKNKKEQIDKDQRTLEQFNHQLAELQKQPKTVEEIEADVSNRLFLDFLACKDKSQEDKTFQEFEELFKIFREENPDLFADLDSLVKEEKLLLSEKKHHPNFSMRLKEKMTSSSSVRLPEGYRINEENDRNIEYYWKKEEEGEIVDQGWEFLCTNLVPDVLARKKSKSKNKQWASSFKLIDADNELINIIITSSMRSDIKKLTETLRGNGVDFSNEKKIREYIDLCSMTLRSENKRILLVDKIGWVEGNENYLLGEKVYGKKSEEEIRLSSTQKPVFEIKGSLPEWQEKIGNKAIGNSRMQIGILLAVVSPLFTPLKREGVGIHYYGSSSSGKTTILKIVRSFYGLEDKTWDTTKNNLTSWGVSSNDNVLILDEVGQVEADVLYHAIYSVGNGRTKGRSDIYGNARDIQSFKTALLSSGELTIAAKISEAKGNITYQAGQDVRLVNINADAGAKLGAFENVHEFKDSSAFARYLDEMSQEYCGTPGDAWLTYLTENLEEAISLILQYEEYFNKECPIPKASDGQIKRVRGHFALMAAAGELAIEKGVIQWEKGSANKACIRVLNDWLKERGSVDSHEVVQGIKRCRSLLEQKGNHLFEEIVKQGSYCESEDYIAIPDSKTVYNRAGFKEYKNNYWQYYVFKEVFEREVIKSCNKSQLLNALVEKGYLTPDKDRFAKEKRLPGFKNKQRVYWIKIAD